MWLFYSVLVLHSFSRAIKFSLVPFEVQTLFSRRLEDGRKTLFFSRRVSFKTSACNFANIRTAPKYVIL